MASDRGAPSIGLCSKCGQKCAETWTASPCKHEACTKCLQTAGNTASCFGCRKTVAFLACPGSRHGCKFDTTKGSWKDHLSKCLFLPLECPNRCGMIVVRKQLLSHFAADCQLRLTACQFCEETVFELEVRDHENSCPKAPVSCPYCLQEGLKREEMEQHTESCSKNPKPCPLREYGCDFSGVAEDIDRHLTVRNHVVCFRELKKSQQERELEMEKLRSELYSCKSDFEACKSQLDSCKNELVELSNSGGAILFDKEMQDFRAIKMRKCNTPDCFTCDTIADNEHVLLHCVAYEQQRSCLRQLMSKLTPGPLTLKSLLGPWPDPSSQRATIEAVGRFLSDTGLASGL